MAQEIAVDIEGLDEVRRGFKAVAGSGKEVGNANREVGRQATVWSKDQTLRTGTRQQRRAMKALLGKGDQRSGSIAIRNLKSMPFGVGAFMGAKKYRQFPPWVGNTWDINDGDGPYQIADALKGRREDLIDIYLDAIRQAAGRAGLEVE